MIEADANSVSTAGLKHTTKSYTNKLSNQPTDKKGYLYKRVLGVLVIFVITILQNNISIV